MSNAAAFLFYGIVIDDEATLKHLLWGALKPEVGPDEESAFHDAHTAELLSAYCETRRCESADLGGGRFAMYAKCLSYNACNGQELRMLGQEIAPYDDMHHVWALNDAYKELFGEERKPAWHLAVIA